MDLNSVAIIGRLTRDAETKSTASGMTVCRFSVAVNRNVKKGDGWETESSFFDVNLWGRLAESLGRYLTKGKQVGIGGELRQERWQQDGQNRSRVIINANNVQLLGGGNQERPPDGTDNEYRHADYGDRDPARYW